MAVQDLGARLTPGLPGMPDEPVLAALIRKDGARGMDLLDMPENRVPHGAAVASIVTADGIRLRAARFPAAPGKPVLGTVCLFQGRAEQIEKYFPVIAGLQQRGFAVATFDWRGQGGSARLTRDRRKGHVRDFLHYERDIEAFRRQMALPDCPPPFFGLAHSMGAHVLLRAAPRLNPWLSRLVLASPFLDFGPTPFSRRTIAALSAGLRWSGFGRSFIPGSLRRYAVVREFEDNPLTSDMHRFRVMMEIGLARPELTIGPPTVGWVHAAVRSMRALDDDRFPPTVNIPVLMVNAGADRMVSVRAVETMARRIRNAGYVLVPGARHELLMERPLFSRQFWAAFDAFVPGAGPV